MCVEQLALSVSCGIYVACEYRVGTLFRTPRISHAEYNRAEISGTTLIAVMYDCGFLRSVCFIALRPKWDYLAKTLDIPEPYRSFVNRALMK